MCKINGMEKCINAFLKDAEDHGAKILENAKVLTWSEDSAGVRIEIEDGRVVFAKKVVVTLGAYTDQLVNIYVPTYIYVFF